MLLVHGYTRTIETNWIEPGVFWNLAADHRVIAFDLRGHGKSGKPHDPAGYQDMAEDATRLLDHLDIRRAHIVGYSLGATIAARTVATNPGRILSLTLGAGVPFRNWTPDSERRAEAAAAELEGDVPFRSLVVAMAQPDEPKPTEDEIRNRSQALAAVCDVMALAAFHRGGRRGLVISVEDLVEASDRMLGIVGSLDPVVAPMKELQKTLPAMTFVVIEGATHARERTALRRPEFVDAIRKFIAAHRS